MVLIKEKIPNNSTTSLFKHSVQNVLKSSLFFLMILHWAEFRSFFFLGYDPVIFWFSDYLSFLWTVYKYSINSWSAGQQLGNYLNKYKKRFNFRRHWVGWWKRRISGTPGHNYNKWSAPLHVHTIKNLEKEPSCWSMTVAIVNYLHLFHELISL